MPATIDAAAYNNLPRIIKTYGNILPWTVKAMDGAAARGRLDIIKKLSESRHEGCSSAAAANGHVEILEWLYEFQEEFCYPVEE